MLFPPCTFFEFCRPNSTMAKRAAKSSGIANGTLAASSSSHHGIDNNILPEVSDRLLIHKRQQWQWQHGQCANAVNTAAQRPPGLAKCIHCFVAIRVLYPSRLLLLCTIIVVSVRVLYICVYIDIHVPMHSAQARICDIVSSIGDLRGRTVTACRIIECCIRSTVR